MPERPPPAYSSVVRMYNTNIRPLVIAITLVLGFWCIATAVSSYKEISDVKHNSTKLATFALILGILFTVAGVIELFGTVAAITARLALIRLFSIAHVGAALIIIATGFMRVILHFLLKNDLLNDCKIEATGQDVDFHFGIWGPRITETLSPADAEKWCNDAYSHDSWSDILQLIVEIIVLGLFTMTVWKYAHGDSSNSGARGVPITSAANPYYEPPYAAQELDYAPPVGPPRHFQQSRSEEEELPGYSGGDGKAYDDAKQGYDAKAGHDDGAAKGGYGTGAKGGYDDDDEPDLKPGAYDDPFADGDLGRRR